MLPSPSLSRRSRRAVTLGVGLAVVLGIAARLYSRSDLWLDEALTVDISRLPVGDLLRQLRHDGHPPLYYLLLHFWMKAFGEGDEAVRSLSGVFGIAGLPLMWLVARRYAGRAGAVAAVVLLATSPFAVRYSTEARMYSLATMLVLAGWLAIRWALDRPTVARLAGVAVASGLLALTHYWGLYLLAATGLLLVWRWRRGDPASFKVAIALAAGGVLFLPWIPSFLAQAAHTGTPWGTPARPADVLAISFSDWGGGPNGEAQLLGVAILVLVLLAVFGRPLSRYVVELDLRTRAAARPELALVLGTLAIAVVAGYATGGAFASRYTAVVFPLVVLLAGLGAAVIADRRLRAGLLVVLALLGLVGGVRNFATQRTQAGEISRYIVANGHPGDVVAFCPDQLGPSVSRLLPDDRIGMTFPDGDSPRLVDWVDYEKRQHGGSPGAFAHLVDQRAGAATVWLVWAPEYRTLGSKCEKTAAALKTLRPGGTPVVASGNEFEHAWLYQYGPVPK